MSPKLLENIDNLTLEEQAMLLFKQIRTLANMVHMDLRDYQNDQEGVDKAYIPNEYLANEILDGKTMTQLNLETPAQVLEMIEKQDSKN